MLGEREWREGGECGRERIVRVDETWEIERVRESGEFEVRKYGE